MVIALDTHSGVIITRCLFLLRRFVWFGLLIVVVLLFGFNWLGLWLVCFGVS